jgi:hypothetical protein
MTAGGRNSTSPPRPVVECGQVRALAASLQLDAKPASFRSLQGWVTTLPLGQDLLGMRRTFDTQALSTAFPFTSPDLPAEPTQATAPAGVLYGLNIASGGLVVWDRFACDNHNAIVLARSGTARATTPNSNFSARSTPESRPR